MEADTQDVTVTKRHRVAHTSRLALRRQASLAQMSTQVRLPPREPGERLGHYYRRCAEVWLRLCGRLEPAQAAVVLRLAQHNPPRDEAWAGPTDA